MKPNEARVLSTGMTSVLVSQFFSAFADNAVLIIALAWIRANGAAGRAPLLQEAFVIPFILLAPFAGPLADGFPKGRVMLLTNLLKLFGAAAMTTGLNPVIAYGIIGIGAAAYSPAKYGILTQLVGPAGLVRANGILEGSTIAAILLGVLAGGFLSDYSQQGAFAAVIVSYLIAVAASLLIPRLDAERPLASLRPGMLVSQFVRSLRTLFSDPDARFSLFGTSVFWGTGATLRLMLFAWAPAALAATSNRTPANLMGVVSIGIILGAAAAGLWISLERTNRALIGGVLLGPVILVLAGTTHLTAAALCMALIGFCGGLFVVPLNALLQERGHRSVGAGSALAVQNFAENLLMLLFVGAYSAAGAAGIPVVRSVRLFGFLVFVAVLGIALARIGRTAGSWTHFPPGFKKDRPPFENE